MHLKIDQSATIIRGALKMCQAPVIYCSFGKDSIVLLHLVTRYLGIKLDVVFHREPFLTHKYRFAEDVISDWRLTAHDWPPSASAMWLGKEILAYTRFYQVGQKEDGSPATMAIPKNILNMGLGEPWVCGKQAFLERPTGTFNYPWDFALIGHKSCDEDQIAGKVPLHKSIVTTDGGPVLVFPMRFWSHEDVWDYTELFNLPVDTNRYDRANRREWPSKTFNSDYYHACTNCIDRRQKGVYFSLHLPKNGKVFCPLVDGYIDSIAEQVAYASPKLDYYGEKEEATAIA